MLRKMILAVQPVRRRIILLAFLVSLEKQKFRNEMTFRRGLIHGNNSPNFLNELFHPSS